MDSDLADNDEDILGFDVPDDVPERAARVSDGKNLKLQFSTAIVMDCACSV